jgi:hypothetical protein
VEIIGYAVYNCDIDSGVGTQIYKTFEEAHYHANPKKYGQKLTCTSGPYYKDTKDGKNFQYSIVYDNDGFVIPIYAELPKKRGLWDRFISAF